MIGYHPFTVFFGVCPQCQTMCQVDDTGNGTICLPHDVCGDRRNGQCSGSTNTAPQITFDPKDMMEADHVLDIGIEVGRRYAGGEIGKYVDDLLYFMEGKECFAQQMTCVLDFKLRMDIRAYDNSNNQ